MVVETQIEGEGSTYTHVETEVNGQKQVFETTEQGKYEIKLESSPSISIQSSPLPPSPRLTWNALIIKIRESLASFLSRLFRF